MVARQMAQILRLQDDIKLQEAFLKKCEERIETIQLKIKERQDRLFQDTEQVEVDGTVKNRMKELLKNSIANMFIKKMITLNPSLSIRRQKSVGNPPVWYPGGHLVLIPKKEELHRIII